MVYSISNFVHTNCLSFAMIIYVRVKKRKASFVLFLKSCNYFRTSPYFTHQENYMCMCSFLKICSQLVLFLGHWPLWSGCQLSSSVCEQHDSPSLGQELGPAVLTAPHIQLMRFSDSTLASLIELPALDMPPAAGGTTPGKRHWISS